MPYDLPQLDPAGLEQMRENFLATLTDFGDFDDVPSQYHRAERAYKDEAARLVHAHLPPALFAGGVEGDPEHSTKVVAATLRVLTTRLQASGTPQNIIGWRYIDLLRKMNDAERAIFAGAMRDLLHRPGESPDRVEAFVARMWPVWTRAWGGGNPFAVSRIFPTCFLMLADPRRDLAVRTDMLTRAGRLQLPDYLLRYRPFNAEDYRRVLAFAAAVRAALQRWGWSPRDMIDIHSFLWVGTRTDAAPDHASSEDA
jgi:hypothetical protein